MVVLSLVTGVSVTPFWIWMLVAFLTGMMFAFLLQTLPRVWASVQGWFSADWRIASHPVG